MEIIPGMGDASEKNEEVVIKDFESATLALEELQRIAAEEPVALKMFNVLGRLSATVAEMVVATFSKYPETYEEAITPVSPTIDAYKKRFEDAAFKLRQLEYKNAPLKPLKSEEDAK